MRRVLVTGGAGFVGSHLCEALVASGDEVVCVDDLSTGRLDNLRGLSGEPRFSFVEGDARRAVASPAGRFDVVAVLASPASPPAYRSRPVQTLLTGSSGTHAALERARRDGARVVLASTSEVYGEPAVHPQPEHYRGNVDPVGPRSCYDEAKRFAEALCTAYRAERNVNAGIVRIFNTYGPRLHPDDGRVVPSFVSAALAGEPLVVHGGGGQTRSLCYVDDLVEGLLAMLARPVAGPVNLGNPEELSVAALAALVLELTGSASPVVHGPRPVDDPSRRCPDVSLAASALGWRPRTPLREGLGRTIRWFAARRRPGAEAGAGAAAGAGS